MQPTGLFLSKPICLSFVYLITPAGSFKKPRVFLLNVHSLTVFLPPSAFRRIVFPRRDQWQVIGVVRSNESQLFRNSTRASPCSSWFRVYREYSTYMPMPVKEMMESQMMMAVMRHSLKRCATAAASLDRGNGSSGIGLSRNLHSGSQPSCKSISSSRSLGTTFLMCALCLLRSSIDFFSA